MDKPKVEDLIRALRKIADTYPGETVENVEYSAPTKDEPAKIWVITDGAVFDVSFDDDALSTQSKMRWAKTH